MRFIRSKSIEWFSLVYYTVFLGNYIALQTFSSPPRWEEFIIFKEEIRIAVAISSVGFYNVIIGRGKGYPNYSGMALAVAFISIIISFCSWQLGLIAFILGMRQLLIGILVISGSRVIFYKVETISLLASVLVYWFTRSLHVAFVVPAVWIFLFWFKINMPIHLRFKDIKDGSSYLLSGVITGFTFLRVKTGLGNAPLYEFEIFLFTLLSGTVFNYVFLKLAEKGRRNFKIPTYIVIAILFYMVTKIILYIVFRFTLLSNYIYSGFVEDTFFLSSWFSLLLVSSFVLMSAYNLMDKPFKTIVVNGGVYIITEVIIAFFSV